MPYESFAGKDATGATVNWVVDQVGGGDILVVKLDVGADGLSTPVTTAAPLPVAIPSVAPSTPLPVREPIFSAMISEGGITATTASAVLKTATGARLYIEISNAGTSGVWVHFAASAATDGNGSYLPPKSSNRWAYSGEVRVIVEAGGASGRVAYVEW